MKTARRACGPLKTIAIRPAARLPGEDGPRAHVKVGTLSLVAAIGRAGITPCKREGDKATPRGSFPIRYGFYRPDRLARPLCRIPLQALHHRSGWCDDPRSPLYNRSVRLPLAAGHEVMWRHDGLYDVVLVLDYNIWPRRAGRGSAIFLHCAKPGWRPTLGCVALRPDDLRKLLPRLAKDARLIVR